MPCEVAPYLRVTGETRLCKRNVNRRARNLRRCVLYAEATSRILNALRKQYGRPLVTLTAEDDGEEETVYAFPTLDELCKATEKELRDVCGLGYRAAYLLKTIQLLKEKGGYDYLLSFRNDNK